MTSCSGTIIIEGGDGMVNILSFIIGILIGTVSIMIRNRL